MRDDETKAKIDPNTLLRASALPSNPDLESSLTRYHARQRDPRERLGILQQFFGSTVLSIASPVGRWDPLDLKPQPFALGSYLGLPVFTSLPYLQHFCREFGHIVRGPDGALWGDTSPPPPDKFLPSALRHHRVRDTAMAEEIAKASNVERFHFKGRGTALPLYGAFERNYLYGYFGDAVTVLENAGSVPESVDIIINPATPLELVMGRAAVSSLVTRSSMLGIARRDVARAVSAELGAFFAATCPEVREARWANVPRMAPEDTLPEVVPHDLVVIVTSDNFMRVLRRVAGATASGKLIGHESLSLVPMVDAPEHVAEVSVPFYFREDITGVGKGLTPMGKSLVVDPMSMDSIGVGYSESHSVYLDEYNRSRGAQ